MSTKKPSRPLSFAGVTAAVVLACGCLLAAHYAFATEKAVSVDALPESIRIALEDVDVDEVEQETENGVTTYEISVVEGGVEIELELDADGKLLRIEVENDDDADDDDADDDANEEDDKDDDEEDDEEDDVSDQNDEESQKKTSLE